MAKAATPEKDLQELYSSDEYARAILDDFASRVNNQRTTKVDQIMTRLKSDALPRTAAINTFRRLGELGYGRFVEGRHGHPSRFLWTASSTEVGRAASGERVSITRVEDETGIDRQDDEDDLISHPFHLRAGVVVTITLPQDLTEKEAERLSGFIRSLPH